MSIGEPVAPTRKEVIAEAQRAAHELITDPEQMEKIITSSPWGGSDPGCGLGVDKGTEKRFTGDAEE